MNLANTSDLPLGLNLEPSSGQNGIDQGIGFFPSLLLLVSIVGVMTNVASIAMFMRQKFRKDFHRLLIVLAGYDLLVSFIFRLLL